MATSVWVKGLGSLCIVGGLATGASAQDRDPWVLYQSDATTLRATLQFGFNLVSEANLFWNLSNFAAPGSGFEPDATWLEVYAKPGLSFETELDNGSKVYARLSGVSSYTAGIDAFDTGDTGRTTLEEAYVGVAMSMGSAASLDISTGARELRLGTGMLISDGASDGFERGALKFGPRRAWESANIVKLSVGDTTTTLFHIDPRERSATDGRNELAGLDVRYDDPSGGFIGFTYIDVLNSTSPYPQAAFAGIGPPVVTPGARDGTKTLNLYAKTNPFDGALQAFSFTGEVAYQWNDRIDLEAWAGRVQANYAFADRRWSPVLSYGYQTFSGDDPFTATQERFDPLFYDGSPSAWATGSKSAMLFINSNVQSHNIALSLQPTPRDKVTLRYAHVRVNELRSPVQFGQATRVDLAGLTPNVFSGVTDPHLSDDFYVEYSRIINRNTFLTAGLSVSVPGAGIENVFPDNTPNWVGGFVNVVFNF